MILKKIEELCAKNGTTIFALEKSLGISVNCIRRWDKSVPRLNNVKKVADYFGVTVDELMKEDE